MKDKHRQLRNWIDKLEAMHTILVSQDMTGKSGLQSLTRDLSAEMAMLQDEFEIEFNRLRDEQKLIRDLLKERREMMNDGQLDASQISKSRVGVIGGV